MALVREGIISVSCVCVIAALCEQLMDRSRYFRVLRMVLGLEIARLLLGCAVRLVQ